MASDDNHALLLQLSAEVRGLEKQFDKAIGIVDTGSRKMEKRAQEASTNLERFFGKTDVAKGLDKIFDSTRFKIFDSGAARVGVFGGALESLGPAGLAAAAGLGVVAFAADQARKSMEWADELQRTSKALGLTTDDLQKLDFAAIATDLGVQKAREGIAAFNIEIGKFETHTGDTRLKKWADAIKLSRDEINQTIDPVNKLAKVMEQIGTLRDAPSRSAAAKAFGLEGFLPIINDGKAGIDSFIAKMHEAQGAGGVVSSDDIQKAAELNAKVNELSRAISNDLKGAFIGLAPTIETVAQFIKDCADRLADFIGAIPAAIRGIENLANAGPKIPIPSAISQPAAGENRLINPKGDIFFDPLARLLDFGPKIPLPGGNPSQDNILASGKASILADKIAELLSKPHPGLHPSDAPPAGQGVGQQLTFDKPKHTATPSDQTATLDAAAKQALETAERAVIVALEKLAGTIQERSALEQQALGKARDIKIDELDKKELEVRKAKVDAHKKEQLALLEKAKAEVQNAFLAESEALRRKTIVDLLTQDQAQHDQQVQARASQLQREQDHLTALAGLALTTAQRTDFEREALAKAQAREVELAQAQVDRARGELAVATALQDQAKIVAAQGSVSAALAGQAALPQQHADQAATFTVQHLEPIQAYLRSLKDVDTEMQNAGVTAAKSLADGLANAIVNAKSLGDVASSVFRQLIAQLLSSAIQRSFAGPILGAFGFAEGGLIQGPGTGTSDSIPARLSHGEYVINARATSQNLPMLQAINSGRPMRGFAAGGLVGSTPTLRGLANLQVPRAAQAGATTILAPVTFELHSPVVTQDLITQMKLISAQSSAQVLQQVNNTAPTRMQSFQALGT